MENKQVTPTKSDKCYTIWNIAGSSGVYSTGPGAVLVDAGPLAEVTWSWKLKNGWDLTGERVEKNPVYKCAKAVDILCVRTWKQ